MRRKLTALIVLILALLAGYWSCQHLPPQPAPPEEVSLAPGLPSAPPAADFDPGALPAWQGAAFAPVNENVPFFSGEEDTGQVFVQFTPLDALGRCGPALACLGPELMPTQPRGEIGAIRPSGWHTVRYDDLIEGRYLYNRCHLLGYQLTGDNATVENLITGTRFLNTQGMLPWENRVAGYITRTGHHVLYRVTPVFQGDDLLAAGVLMEAASVEDGALSFCVFVYNVQPGVIIDYATGDSARAEDLPGPEPAPTPEVAPDYIVNVHTGKFHRPDCPGAAGMKAQNKLAFNGSRDELTAQGYLPCGQCKP